MTKYPKTLTTTESSFPVQAGFSPTPGVYTAILAANGNTSTKDLVSEKLNGYVGTNVIGAELAATYLVTFTGTPGIINTHQGLISVSGLTYVYYIAGNTSTNAKITATLAANTTKELFPGLTLVANAVNITLFFNEFQMPITTTIEFRTDTSTAYAYALTKIVNYTTKE